MPRSILLVQHFLNVRKSIYRPLYCQLRRSVIVPIDLVIILRLRMHEHAYDNYVILYLVLRYYALLHGICNRFCYRTLRRSKYPFRLLHIPYRNLRHDHRRRFNRQIRSYHREHRCVPRGHLAHGVCKCHTYRPVFIPDHQINVCNFRPFPYQRFTHVHRSSPLLSPCVI